MTSSGSGLWAFYHVQGEDGEDRAHPNAFRLAGVAPGAAVTLADVLRAFPLPDAAAFHFRFRLNGGGGSFCWLDAVSPAQKVPVAGGRVICKLLRLERPVKAGLVFRRRPALKWAPGSGAPRRQGSSGALADGSAAQTAVQPLARGAGDAPFHRSSSTPAFEAGRPAKYSDRASPSGSERRHGNAAASLAASTGDKKPKARTGSAGAKPAEAAPESFEDFLSGGQQPADAAAPPAKDVNLMSASGWADAPAATAQPSSTSSAFLSAMDPLAARSPPASQASPASKSAAREPPKFEDDNGQTVGPVTMAEMQEHSKSTADGSNVYNPSLVDKSLKSDDVRRAMEERERQVQRDVDKAREDLRQREEAVRSLAAMKEGANAVLGPKLKLWAEDNGRIKNIRTLLSTMHQVMWEGSKWTEVNMGKLLQPSDVKKHYRKAMIVVHPDKSGGRNAEQLLIAERVFAAVNAAWEEFLKTNTC
ncbi:hypothetical protein BBJ28_00009941 [Nothophytophthora sp. Chile5]|nr:hypothetical protein BBJ28_00009941 [Nothophytophthora sp. Chile5]